MFCKNCGTNIPENTHFCPTCGEPVFGEKVVRDESDHTALFSPEDIERTRFISALCYLSFIFIIIALLLEPNSKFLRFHINQSIMLTLFGLCCGIVAIIPFIGWIGSLVGAIAFVVFTIMGIVNAVKRKAKDIPLVGKYTVVNYD